MSAKKKEKINWIKFTSRGHHPLLYIDTVFTAHGELFQKYFGLPKITAWARHSGSFWVDKKGMEKIYAGLRKKLYTSWPIKILRWLRKDFVKLTGFCKTISRIENPKPAIFKKAFDFMKKPWLATYFPIIVGRVIERHLCKSWNSERQSENHKLARRNG